MLEKSKQKKISNIGKIELKDKTTSNPFHPLTLALLPPYTLLPLPLTLKEKEIGDRKIRNS